MLEGTCVNSFIVKSADFEMTDSELLRQGIVIVKDGMTQAAAVELIKKKDKSIKVIKESMSPLKGSTVIAYNSTIDPEYIKDMWSNKNFYTITLERNGTALETVENAYIREDYVEEDLKYYINYVFSNKSPEINSIDFVE